MSDEAEAEVARTIGAVLAKLMITVGLWLVIGALVAWITHDWRWGVVVALALGALAE